MAEPPLLTGAVQRIFALRIPAVAVTVLGAPATVRGVTDTPLESKPLPIIFTALTFTV